jgi:hypothetical protein
LILLTLRPHVYCSWCPLSHSGIDHGQGDYGETASPSLGRASRTTVDLPRRIDRSKRSVALQIVAPYVLRASPAAAERRTGNARGANDDGAAEHPRGRAPRHRAAAWRVRASARGTLDRNQISQTARRIAQGRRRDLERRPALIHNGLLSEKEGLSMAGDNPSTGCPGPKADTSKGRSTAARPTFAIGDRLL